MRTAALILVAALAGAPLARAQQANDSDVKSRIIALERLARLHACQAKDLKTLDTLIADDSVHLNVWGNQQTKAELLRFVQSADSIEFLIDAVDVRLHGDTAIVTGLFSLKGATGGTPFARRGRFVDTWLFKDGKWVVIATLATPANSQ